jgi:pSer/pThr/pTyr-binding forkhead associated (FHA) protein
MPPAFPPDLPPQREATYLESGEEIRQAILARQAALRRQQAPAGPGPAPPPAAAAESLDAAVRSDRPRERPPMALLSILDDGKSEGEEVRLRGDRCVLGRTDGDVVIPHDSMMSGRHAELLRQKTASGYRWVLNDLGSTNGTFVRIGKSLLHDRAEFVVGRGRYRFDAGQAAAPADAPPLGTTLAWTGSSSPSVLPTLVEITPAGLGGRVLLAAAEYWVGRDALSCQVVRADDLTVNARHARLFRDPRGQWYVENNKSVNGLWLRVEQMPLAGTCQFRLGEQRFIFRVL